MEEKWRNLRELEAQRSDLVTKLEKIEEKKTTVSAEVYSKVKKEYEDKLKKVEHRLTEFLDLMKEETTRLKKEEEKFVAQEGEINLKMEELELRYSIGEYDDASFKVMEKENKDKVQSIAIQLQKLRERIKWFGDFVEIKGLEKTLETPKETPPKKKDIEIEEHILEEKPTDGIKLDDLLIPEEAVKPEVSQEKEASAKSSSAVKKEGEKGVTCPKCGFVNAPDSWYCDKCGAEIFDSFPK